ncbi:oligosaccharide flippase family protein [Nocardioides campestrisoli]|uniref:oligosaccharide flippase family protein n=1 Tax=Nocardioides campestrisoli TaxID=2736757 RepID=UPI0015E733F6|nr:polysaccharide biosynthesis C-terminal domain-containing protein [Nocardioides campestrisoli]
MTEARQHLRLVARGASLSLLGSGVSAVATFGLVLVVARAFDPGTSGLFFAASALFLILVGFAGLGIDSGMARFGQRLEHEGRPDGVRVLFRTAGSTVTGIAVGLGALLLLAAGPVAQALDWGRGGADLLRLAGLALPLAVVAEYAQAGTRAFGRMHETVVIDRIGRSVAQVAGVAVAGAAGAGEAGLMLAWLAWYPVAALWSLLALRRFLGDRVPSEPVDGLGPPGTPPGAAAEAPLATVRREFWRFTWPRSVSVLARLGIQKSDVVLVAALLTPQDAAVYAAATRFVALGQVAATAVTQVLQPRFAALVLEGSRDNLATVHQTATAWNVLLSWPLYLLVGCAPAAYLGLFGSGYDTEQSRWVVVAMTVAMLVAVSTGPVDTLLVMAGRSATSMATAVASLVVDLLLCLLLLPVLGILGAALAWGAAVLLKAGLAVHFVRREVQVSGIAPVVLLAGGVCLLTVAVPVLVLTGAGVAWPFAAAVAALAYLVAVRVLRRQLRLDVLGRSAAPAPLRSLTPLAPPGPSVPHQARTAPTYLEGAPLVPLRRITSTVRRRAPGPLVRALRAVALGWGWLTADLRMTPSVVVVGAQRCGTTTLFRMLEDHPNLMRPTQSKGTGYFDDHHAKGARWYRAQFPLRLTGRLLGGREARAFECSGYYLFHPLAARRLAAELPDAQVVVLVRDPVERAMSAHRHELARGFEDLPLDEALARESERLAGEAERLAADPDYRSYAHRHHGYLARGEYGDQIARFVDALGPDRVHVVDADALFADPVHEFVDLQRRLDIPVHLPERVERWNARPGGPRLPVARRAELLAHFESSDAQLATYLGRPPRWRQQHEDAPVQQLRPDQHVSS